MKNGAFAFVLAALALGVAVFALTKEPDAQQQRTSDQSARLDALEQKVEELTLELEYAKSGQQPSPARGDATDSPMPLPSEVTKDPAIPREGGETSEALTAIVDDAVDRKTKQVIDEMRLKANKKPGIDVFASTLGLNKSQRAQTERIVAEGQRKLHEILNVPAHDGSNLMDELVDLMAKGIAEPGKDHGVARWFGRIVSEKIPGTDVTYAARIESIKNAMRTDFKREWTKEQYREFEEWKVDPTEIQNVADSPNAALMTRIVERARALGAEIPDDK